MSSSRRYNLRVYAIIVNSRDEVLVSDELRFGNAFTKFPGGGMEWGEGTKDTLKREIKEELQLDCEVGDLFFVNDFYQESAYRPSDQLVSFYYEIKQIRFEDIVVTNHSIPLSEEGEKFRWISRNELTPSIFTFPIDKIVCQKLIS